MPQKKLETTPSDYTDVLNLPISEADHQGHNRCPHCQADKGVLSQGVYDCGQPNCNTRFQVKDILNLPKGD